jgi:hypothetical protein
MMIALLDYKLNEFMETIFEKDVVLKDLQVAKSVVRRLCNLNHQEIHTNGKKANGNRKKRGFDSLEISVSDTSVQNSTSSTNLSYTSTSVEHIE